MSRLIPAWVDGTLTPVDKMAVHRRGLRHKAVSVFVVRDRSVLLQRRALGKYHTPGLWANTCCTHPNWNETALACAIRRLDEELGITGLDPQHRQHVEYRADVGQGLVEHEVVDVFVAVAPDDLVLRPDPDEVMKTRWVAFPDIVNDIALHPERYTPWLKIYLKDHASAILGSDWSAT
jgi:isopentenyl-diphosphate delta-isomerase